MTCIARSPSGYLRWAGGLAVVIAIWGAASPTLGAAQNDPTAEMSPEQTASAIEALSAQLRSEIGRQVATTSVEQFEASILFVVDQSGQSERIICSAFDLLKAEPNIPANAKAAMTNVCQIIGRRRGTGAISNGSGQFSGANFSSPVISLGGGGTNYTPQR